MRTLLPTASEAVSRLEAGPVFHALRTRDRPQHPDHPGRGGLSRRLHRRHRRRRRPVDHPCAAHRRGPAAPGAGYQQAELDLRCGDRQLHLLPAQAVPSREVAQRFARHRDRRRHRRLGGSPAARRVAEPDAPGGGIHLRPLHALRRHAEGAAGRRCAARTQAPVAAGPRPGLLRRRGGTGHRSVLDRQLAAHVPAGPGPRQRCGAEHELRQQHSGAGGVHRLRPGDLVARPVHGCVADGRRLFRRAHRHRRRGEVHSPGVHPGGPGS